MTTCCEITNSLTRWAASVRPLRLAPTRPLPRTWLAFWRRRLPQIAARSGSRSGWATRLARETRSPVHMAAEKSANALIP